MATATATTVSTGSDYTTDSKVGRTTTSKNNVVSGSVGGDRTGSPGQGDQPVVWYAFHSESAGREYYYEPISRTATWIMPDDYHPHPITNDGDGGSSSRSAGTSMRGGGRNKLLPPKVKRKVSFQSSGGNRELTVKDSSKSKYIASEVGKGGEKEPAAAAAPISLEVSKLEVERAFYKPFCVGVMILCSIVLIVVLYIGQESILLPVLTGSSPLGFQQQHQNVAEGSMRASVIDTAENHSNEKVIKAAKLVVKESFKEPPQNMVDISAPKIEKQEEGAPPTQTETKVGSIAFAADSADKMSKEEESPAPPKCKVPFAYILSGECRRRNTPIFDAEKFVLSMMQ